MLKEGTGEGEFVEATLGEGVLLELLGATVGSAFEGEGNGDPEFEGVGDGDSTGNGDGDNIGAGKGANVSP